MAKKIKLVRGALKYFSSERTQYKPYNYALDFTKEGGSNKTILVELEVPDEYVIEDEGEVIVLSFDGLNAMLELAADKIDELSEKYMNRFIQ